MAEAGYGKDRPGWRRVAAGRAVLEDCRLVCVAGLHAAGMSLGDAGAVFEEEAGLAEVSARAEALRCAADPGRAAGGLGRAILRGVRARHGGPPGMPGATFLEAVLSAGAAPVGLLDRLLT
jgi:uncharacterized protein (DUF885 family)